MTDASAPTKPKRHKRPRDTSGASRRRQSPVAAKVNPMLIAAAIALIVVGALAGWYVLNTQSTTTSVVTITQDVPRGAAISADSLGTIDVNDADVGGYIPVANASDVAGRTALTDLTAGTPLTDANTGTISTASAEAIVGVPLTSAQMPSTAIAAGDTVSVVSTAANTAESGTTPMSIDATVFSIRTDSTSGLTIVDLTIAPDEARTVAAMAASGDVALVLIGGGDA